MPNRKALANKVSLNVVFIDPVRIIVPLLWCIAKSRHHLSIKLHRLFSISDSQFSPL